MSSGPLAPRTSPHEQMRARMPGKYERYATHKHSRRWAAWDYTQPAAYLPSVSRCARVVTVCTHHRQCLFGEVKEGTMVLNEAGQIVAEEWLRSEIMREEMTLDAFVIMPNRPKGDS